MNCEFHKPYKHCFFFLIITRWAQLMKLKFLKKIKKPHKDIGIRV
ncbi:hypothetical protein JIP0899_1540041 [Flavobacterium psychrophilum]|nr:hypothetical protein JIP0899_1540041 [Flavobacterium psychrophilum]SNB06701.1 hypothetical protein JIP1600_1430010 [Flavobacterium psychrophilum]